MFSVFLFDESKTEALHVLELWILGQRVNGSDGGAPGPRGSRGKKRDVEPEHSARELGMSLVFMQLRKLGDGLSIYRCRIECVECRPMQVSFSDF